LSLRSKKFLLKQSLSLKKYAKRGGGILDITLEDKTDLLPNYYQLHATFETKDSMGANFINSCLEQFMKTLKTKLSITSFSDSEKKFR
jgi:hydroxymethylglutaryl-CoA reductase